MTKKRQIDVGSLSVKPVESFDDMVEDTVGKKCKSAVSKKSKSKVSKNTEKVEKKTTARKKAGTVAKNEDKLVEKTGDTVGTKEPKISEVKNCEDIKASKPKRTRKKKEESTEVVEPTPEKLKRTRKKKEESTEVVEPTPEVVETTPEKPKRTRKKKTETPVTEAETPKTEETTPEKPKRTRKKKTETPVAEAETPKTEETTPEKPKRTRKKKTETPVTEAETSKDLTENPVTEAEIPKKPKKPTKKKTDNPKTITTPKKVAEPVNGMDVLISFDTTGSMYPVLAQVKTEVTKLVKDMAATIKDLRVGIIVHGDYCDKDHPYTLRAFDFTDDVDAIYQFIKDSGKTYGGDADECYELVLRKAHTIFNWDLSHKKAMVLIGDANPHSVSYPENTEHINWRDEVKALKDKNIKVYAVHALSNYRRESTNFYKTLASGTDGVYLTLDYFNEIIELIKTACYSEYSVEKLDEYVEIIRKNNKLSNGIIRNLNRLYGREVVKCGAVDSDGLEPVLPGRFQTLTVDSDIAIKQFVLDNGIEFKRGRAFYELSKSEKVQQYKEIIIQNRETGEMYTGPQVREYLGLQPQTESGGVTERLNSHHTKEYRVFVQSTSVNRKLIGGTELLYEMKDA